MARKKKIDKSSRNCMCGDNCHALDAWLPGYLLICLGFLALSVNFGLLDTMTWAKAWPLLLVLGGVVMVIKVELCRRST